MAHVNATLYVEKRERVIPCTFLQAPPDTTIITSTPRVITVDKNAASPKAIAELKATGVLPQHVELRQVTYLNNLIIFRCIGYRPMLPGSIRSKSGSVCYNANVYSPITSSQQALWKPRSVSTSAITIKRPSRSTGLTPSSSLNTSLHRNRGRARLSVLGGTCIGTTVLKWRLYA